MIQGTVDANLDAVISLPLLDWSGQWAVVVAIIDTGFEGFLMLPPADILALGWPSLGPYPVYLADDSLAWFNSHLATVEVDGGLRQDRVLAMGSRPVVGTKLLAGCKVTIELKPGGTVTIERLP